MLVPTQVPMTISGVSLPTLKPTRTWAPSPSTISPSAAPTGIPLTNDLTTPNPTSSNKFDLTYISNSTWTDVDKGWELRHVFGGLRNDTNYYFSLSLAPRKSYTSRELNALGLIPYARVTAPTGLFECSLCSSSTGGSSGPAPAQGASSQSSVCIAGRYVRCKRDLAIPGHYVDPHFLNGSLTFRVLVRGVEKGFTGQLWLKDSAPDSQADDLAPTPTPSPSNDHRYEFDGMANMNSTSISIWFIVIVFFVAMCAYRVFRQHRLNAITRDRAGSRGVGAYGNEHEPEFDEEDLGGLRGIILRRQVAMSPLGASASRLQLQPAAAVDNIPRAQARVLSAHEAEQSASTHQAVAVAAPVVMGSPRISGEYRI